MSSFLDVPLASGRAFRFPAGFSLVEVVLALGIISFAVVALLGLLPAGLSAQRQATSRARCVQVLSALSDTARGIYVQTSTNETTGEITKTTNFPHPLEGITPGTAGATTYALLGNGMVTNSGDDVRGRIYIRQDAPQNDVIPIYISVAWPASASRSNGSWSTAQGAVESLVFVNLP